MSFPAQRSRRRRYQEGRGGLSTSPHYHQQQPCRQEQQNLRDPLLLEDERTSRFGHVELTDLVETRSHYKAPSLQDDLPIVEGLVVQQQHLHQQEEQHPQRIYPQHTLANARPLVNANPVEDLSIPCISHGCLCVQCVRTQEIGFRETFGSFTDILGPGLHCMPWPMTTISQRLSLRIQQLDIVCEVNTLDKVFCRLHLSVLFCVSVVHSYEAGYYLKDVSGTVHSLVVDAVRGTVPSMDLDTLFQSCNHVVDTVFSRLYQQLRDYGYELRSLLLTRIDPDFKVRAALSEAPAATRWKQAATFQAEAIRIERVKHAEAAAERSYLHGVGVARQRRALVDSFLKVSMQEWMDDVYVQAPTHTQVMELLLVTQYFDVLMEVKAERVILPVG